MKYRKAMVTMILIAAAGISACLSGCSKKKEDAEKEIPHSLSLVIGAHKNFPVVSLNTDSIYSDIYDACYTWGNVSAVVVDGAPFMACNYDINAPKNRIDESKREQLASDNTEKIMSKVSSARAKTPEVDTLSAIIMSANALQGVKGEAHKTMIVIDSGVCNTSLLNFSDPNLIHQTPENIVAQLKELHSIPDLSGIRVLWVGIGQTCGTQEKLPLSYQYKHKSIWNAILEEGGAEEVIFDPTPITSESYDQELPACSSVPVTADGLEITEGEIEEKLKEGIFWDEFHGDQSEFIDRAETIGQLEPVAEYLNGHPSESIHIFGMTATITGGSSGVELAEERANACKAILVSQGADEAQITAVGLGQADNPLRTWDVDENGRQIDELARKNRAVFIIKSDSEMTQVLLNCVPDPV